MVCLYHNPFVPLKQLRDEFDRALNTVLGVSPAAEAGKPTGRIVPALNLWEENNALKVEAELLGLKAEDIEVSVLGGELSIEGRLPAPEADEGTYHRRERAHGEFRRVVRLPFDVETDKVEASLRDGVLLITLPKAAAARPHKITVASQP